MGLAYVSAELTQFDQQIKFLTTDFWNAPEINKEFYNTEIEPIESAQNRIMGLGGNTGAAFSQTYDLQKKNWLTQHGVLNVLNVLAGHREYLLDRYHLLGIEVDGVPLYQLIYQAMQSAGFPSAKMVQAPVALHLPAGNDPIPMPATFEQAVDHAFSQLVNAATQARELSTLERAVNGKIDQALIQSLQANTERLTELSSEIDYSGSRKSPLLRSSPAMRTSGPGPPPNTATSLGSSISRGLMPSSKTTSAAATRLRSISATQPTESGLESESRPWSLAVEQLPKAAKPLPPPQAGWESPSVRG